MDAPPATQASPPARPGGGALVPAGQAPASQGGAPEGAAAGWSLEVVDGPNTGATVPLEAETRLGSGLDNDVVLADGDVAENQALFVPDGERCLLDPLADGMTVNNKPAPAGRFVVLRDGLVVRAGATTIRVHGPAVKRKRAPWLLAAVPALLAVVGVLALVGVGPSGGDKVVPPPPPPALPTLRPSEEAAAALQGQLQRDGLDQAVKVTYGPGVVTADGVVGAPELARWRERQKWFDASYPGVSLRNQVREAPPGDKPSIPLKAVSVGSVPYFITATGDRYVIGSLFDGWLVEGIDSDKITLSKAGRQAEIRLQ